MSEKVLLNIEADNKSALSSIDKINKKLKLTENQGKKNNAVFSKMGAILGSVAIAGTFAMVGKRVIKTASDLEEAENKLNAVFGSKGQALINDFATKYQKDIGASILQTKNFIADAGNLFNGFGMGEEQARKFSTEVLKLTNDLASFNNLSNEDAQRRMMSALMGESQSAKSLGASILEDQMKRASLALGLGEYSNKMDELTKIQIRYKAILMQSQKAVGDSKRSVNSYNGQMKYLYSTVEKVSIAVGKTLLPAVTAITKALVTSINYLYENSEAIKAVISGITAGAVAYSTYYVAVNGVSMATKALTLAQWALNTAMKANPVGLIIAGISTLVGLMIYFYNTNEKVRYAFVIMWESMKNSLNIFMNLFITSMNGYIRIYNKVASIINKPLVAEIEFMEIKNASEIANIAKAKELSFQAKKAKAGEGILYGEAGGAGAYTGDFNTSGTDTKDDGNGESYFKTFNKAGDIANNVYNKEGNITNNKNGTLNIGDITINITQKDGEDEDALLDRITYKIANEFNRAGKIAGII